MGDAGNFWKMKRGGAGGGCGAEGVGGWIGARKGWGSTRGRGLPRIISFNYSKMSGWITSYFFLELTFNGLSALPATTDSSYILPLEEGGRSLPNVIDIVVVGLRSPIKIDRVLDGRDDNLSSSEPRTILRNRRASRSRCSQKLAVRKIDYAMFAKVWLLATAEPAPATCAIFAH